VKKRVREGLTADPEASRKDLTAAVKDHLKKFCVYSGVHSEPKVAEGVSHRTDVRQGLVRVVQVYTEHAPCVSCQEVMNNQLPALRPAPFFLLHPLVPVAPPRNPSAIRRRYSPADVEPVRSLTHKKQQVILSFLSFFFALFDPSCSESSRSTHSPSGRRRSFSYSSARVLRQFLHGGRRSRE
jgi:hypothetical protein